MKKIIFLLFIVVAAISCNNSAPGTQEGKKEVINYDSLLQARADEINADTRRLFREYLERREAELADKTNAAPHSQEDASQGDITLEEQNARPEYPKESIHSELREHYEDLKKMDGKWYEIVDPATDKQIKFRYFFHERGIGLGVRNLISRDIDTYWVMLHPLEEDRLIYVKDKNGKNLGTFDWGESFKIEFYRLYKIVSGERKI